MSSSVPSSSQRPSSVILNFFPGETQPKVETDNSQASVEELRAQIHDLMNLVDALRKEHGWVFPFPTYKWLHLLMSSKCL